MLKFKRPVGATTAQEKINKRLLVIYAFIFVLFCVTRYGWGWNNFKEEANTGKGLKVKNWMRGYLTYILPIVIFVFFAIGIYNFFK
mgnify:CR=1 FL=1